MSESKAAETIGLNRAAVAKWKRGAVPNGHTLSKLAELFHVTVGLLLGTEGPEAAGRPEGDELKLRMAAYWGGEQELSREELDELWSDAESYYKFKLEQMRKKKRE